MSAPAAPPATTPRLGNDTERDTGPFGAAVAYVPLVAEALARFASALDLEAAIRDEDVAAVRGSLLRSQQVLADTAVWAQRRGSEAEIASPVFVIGFLRTGSTLVHNLLGLHADLYAPRLWELAQPVEAASADGDGHRRALQATAQAYVEDYYRKAPALPAVHFLDAGRPDECHRLLANTFQSMVLEMRYRVPSYGDWLHRCDLVEAYRWHRRQLAAIMSAHRRPDGTVPVPVLKCPFHTWFLPALVAAYPGARFVHLHRDPVSVVASTASLCRVVRRARSDAVDDREVGAYWSGRVTEMSVRLAHERDHLVDHRPVVDVRYDELMTDPAGVLERACALLDVPHDPSFPTAVRQYLAEHPAGQRGEHRYHPEEFGLSAPAIAASTSAYRRRFGV